MIAVQGSGAGGNRTRHNMLGMQIDYGPPEAFLDAFAGAAGAREAGYACVTNVHQCILVHDDASLREKVNAARFVIPDSVILERARSLRHRVRFRPTMRGAEMMIGLCARAAGAGLPVALVGGRDEQCLDLLKARLIGRFPTLKIVHAVSPPFRPATEAEDKAMTEALVASGARIVFVGLGCPKQEKWMAAHSPMVRAMMIGVGAAFDFNAGIIKPSPAWVHRAGLEWLYRLISEPKRLWRRYLTTSPRFLWLVARDVVSGGGRSP